MNAPSVESFDVTRDLALTAAIQILLESAEVGRSPSGEDLTPAVVELHRQAAQRLEQVRQDLRPRP